MLRGMSVEKTKTFKVTPKHAGVPEWRMRIGAAADLSGVRVVSLEETPSGRSSTKVEVTVAGHPSQIRSFQDELFPVTPGGASGGGDLSQIAFDAAIEFVVDPVWKAAREKWYRRREAPLPGEVVPGPGEARTTCELEVGADAS